jgi:hypothetical protein
MTLKSCHGKELVRCTELFESKFFGDDLRGFDASVPPT